MGAGMFWGIFFILIGIGIVLRVLFHVDLPIFKFLIAFLFIWIGIRIIFGSHIFSGYKAGGNNVIFGEKNWTSDSICQGEYNVIFGKAVYDLRDVKPEGTGPYKVEIHTVFAESIIKVKKDMPLRIDASAAFAGAQMPNGNNAVLGSVQYQSSSFRADSAYLYVKADVAFGGLRIDEY